MAIHPRLQKPLIAAFLAALFLPPVAGALGVGMATSENRALAPAPKWGQALTSSTRFMRDLKAYLPDHYGFRGSLVRGHALLTLKGLGSSPSTRVLLGKEGWLFYNDEGITDQYRGLKPFTEPELQRWQRLLERRRAWCAQQGATYLFVVAPNTHSIYPEFLPDAVTQLRRDGRLDQLLAHLKAQGSPVQILDLRTPLRAAKATERVYDRTDTHWNARGAFVAAQEIARALGLPLADRAAFRETRELREGGDLAGMLGLKGDFQEEVLGLTPASPVGRLVPWSPEAMAAVRGRCNDAADSTGGLGPTAVVFHDSFGLLLRPFLAERFARATYMWNVIGFEQEPILSLRPAFVIQEVTERYLMRDLTEAEGRTP